jgi:hypothetical protein
MNSAAVWRISYHARQALYSDLSVFCKPTSEFICVSRCSRKMMVALKDIRNYTGLGQSPMSSLKGGLSSCSSVQVL